MYFIIERYIIFYPQTTNLYVSNKSDEMFCKQSIAFLLLLNQTMENMQLRSSHVEKYKYSCKTFEKERIDKHCFKLLKCINDAINRKFTIC